MNRQLRGVAEAIAAVGTAKMRVWFHVVDPIVRLWRLCRLRACTKGCIPVTTQFDGPVQALRGSRVFLGERCRLGHGVFFETPDLGAIRVGSHVRINQGTVIVAATSVQIGDDTLIGEYVSIRDADHGMLPGTPMRLQQQTSKPIVIGADVWIGRGAVVLKGVTLGDGAVVAANSVVTKNVPPMTIVAGVPAKTVKTRAREAIQESQTECSRVPHG